MALTTPRFRGSYVTVTKPRAIAEGEPKYSITIALEKDNPRTAEFMSKLKKSAAEKMTEKFGKPVKPKYPLYLDGDEHEKSSGEKDTNWAGCWVIKASCAADRKPALFEQLEDGTKLEAEDVSKFYSGAYFRASVDVFAWGNTFGKGVSVSLRSVLFLEDGEPLGGGLRATADDYADMDDEPEPKGKPQSASKKPQPKDEVVVTDEVDIFL